VNGAVSIVALGATGLGVNYLKKRNSENEEHLLRPPGAIEEEDFLFACIKCGLCVQICPIGAVKLADITDDLSYGTPYLNLREQACDFSCDSLQCAETCPTAALDFKQFKTAGEEAITTFYKENPDAGADFNPFKVQISVMKEAVGMGVAVYTPRNCLAHHGEPFKGKPRGEDFTGVHRSPNGEELRATPLNEREFDRQICNLCVTECPIGEKAIVMEEKTTRSGREVIRPRVLEGCTGCGVCEMVCPTEPASISIINLQIAEK